VLERNASANTELAPPGATPTIDTHPRRIADFDTLGEALDYAAQGRPASTSTMRAGRSRVPIPIRSCARMLSSMRGTFWRSGSRPATASRW
jgi:hypothetical protein